MTYDEFAKNGYLMDKNDFKNFEATIYWRRIKNWISHGKCEGSSKPDQMTIYGRGGVHVDVKPNQNPYPRNCLATCYKGSFDYKKYNHTNKTGTSILKKNIIMSGDLEDMAVEKIRINPLQ